MSHYLSSAVIAVDFDSTLAFYDTWKGPTDLGAPIQPMVDLVKSYLEKGNRVVVFTARAFPLNECFEPEDDVAGYASARFKSLDLSDPRWTIETKHALRKRYENAVFSVLAIRKWCAEHLGVQLPVTNVKSYDITVIYDDRAVQVVPNTGRLVLDETAPTVRLSKSVKPEPL